MSSESFKQDNEPKAEDAAKSRSLGNKLRTATQVALATGAVAIGAVGCGDHPENPGAQADKPDRFEKQSDLAGDLERNESRTILDQKKLALYHEAMGSGVFGNDFRELTRYRAIELAIKKGLKVRADSEIIFTSSGGVPVEIKIDGQYVPISPDDYTKDELRAAHAAESIRKSMEKPTDSRQGVGNHSVGTFGEPNNAEIKRNRNPWGDAPNQGNQTNPDAKDFF